MALYLRQKGVSRYGQIRFQVSKLLHDIGSLAPDKNSENCNQNAEKKRQGRPLLDLETSMDPSRNRRQQNRANCRSEKKQETDTANPEKEDGQRNCSNSKEREAYTALEFVIHIVHSGVAPAFLSSPLSLSRCG